MDVNVVSSAGTARGPLVGHFGSRTEEPRRAARRARRRHGADSESRRVEDARHRAGRLHMDVQPRRDRFQVCRSARRGLRLPGGERARAGRVRVPTRDGAGQACCGSMPAAPRTAPPRRRARHSDFATPSRPLSYRSTGTFRNLDMRRLPDRLSMPKLETQAAGNYPFEAQGRDWTRQRQCSTTRWSKARGSGRARCSASNRAIVSSATRRAATSRGSTRADSRRRSKVKWLDDDRFNGSLTGAFTFNGSGRTIDDLVLNTNASLVDSTLAGARFPTAAVDFQMAEREIRAKFSRPVRRAAGNAVHRPQGACRHDAERIGRHGRRADDSEGRSDELLNVSGTATLTNSTIAGMAIDSGAGDRLVRESRSPTSRSSSLDGPGSESERRGHARARRHGTNRTSRTTSPSRTSSRSRSASTGRSQVRRTSSARRPGRPRI